MNEGIQTSTTIVGVLSFSIDSHYQQTKFDPSLSLSLSLYVNLLSSFVS
ncbi:hypothetical protein CsSME_00025336 [Camellia sinensis var. sinensis]